jgi:hypothetical protein
MTTTEAKQSWMEPGVGNLLEERASEGNARADLLEQLAAAHATVAKLNTRMAKLELDLARHATLWETESAEYAQHHGGNASERARNRGCIWTRAALNDLRQIRKALGLKDEQSLSDALSEISRHGLRLP